MRDKVQHILNCMQKKVHVHNDVLDMQVYTILSSEDGVFSSTIRCRNKNSGSFTIMLRKKTEMITAPSSVLGQNDTYNTVYTSLTMKMAIFCTHGNPLHIVRGDSTIGDDVVQDLSDEGFFRLLLAVDPKYNIDIDAYKQVLEMIYAFEEVVPEDWTIVISSPLDNLHSIDVDSIYSVLKDVVV